MANLFSKNVNTRQPIEFSGVFVTVGGKQASLVLVKSFLVFHDPKELFSKHDGRCVTLYCLLMHGRAVELLVFSLTPTGNES